MNSPFRYAGGKFYARRLILEHIPIHSSFIEPFAGGASIFFAKTKVESNWLNDIDSDLVNCLEIIRDRPQELIDVLSGEVATKERHGYYKNEFKPKNSLEKAVRWFYLNRTSYSGIMNMQNCYWGYGDKYSMRPENWPRNITQSSRKLHGVRITSVDFEYVLNEAESNAFLFIDPPYFNADQDKFYTYAFSKQDHLRLCEVLKANRDRFNFLLTYDDGSEIRDLYSWCTSILAKEWNYTINRTDDQKNGTREKGSRYKGKEVFIMNYGCSQKNGVQLDLLDYANTIDLKTT